MPVRMDIELTSERGDGTWTWRAAGARQPKGVLEATLLPAAAKVGDVVRAETDVTVEGITVLSVLPPKQAKAEPERLELIPSSPDTPGVTTSLVGRDRDRDRDRPRRDRDGRRDGPRRDGPRREGARRDGGDSTRSRPTARPARPERPRAEEPPPRPRPKRLQPARTHRNALLASLPPEQQPVAEQMFRGGVPAVRQAIKEQNEKRAPGEPEIKAEPFIAIAEELVPRVRAAEWRDRAEAALADVDTVGLRDLRAVVAGADTAARDDDTRALASQLREALERRGAAEREAWVQEITAALDDARVVRALRISGRPPEPGVRFPDELGERLAQAAGAALAGDAGPDRWLAVLDAVKSSPVRSKVEPAGLPAAANDDFRNAAREAVGQVPRLGPLLGIEAAPRTSEKRPPPPPKRPPPPPSATDAAAAPPAPDVAPEPDGSDDAAPAEAGSPPEPTPA